MEKSDEIRRSEPIALRYGEQYAHALFAMTPWEWLQDLQALGYSRTEKDIFVALLAEQREGSGTLVWPSLERIAKHSFLKDTKKLPTHLSEIERKGGLQIVSHGRPGRGVSNVYDLAGLHRQLAGLRGIDYVAQESTLKPPSFEEAFAAFPKRQNQNEGEVEGRRAFNRFVRNPVQYADLLAAIEKYRTHLQCETARQRWSPTECQRFTLRFDRFLRFWKDGDYRPEQKARRIDEADAVAKLGRV